MMKADTELGRIDRPPSLKHSSDDHPRDNAANDNLVGVLLIYNHNVFIMRCNDILTWAAFHVRGWWAGGWFRILKVQFLRVVSM